MSELGERQLVAISYPRRERDKVARNLTIRYPPNKPLCFGERKWMTCVSIFACSSGRRRRRPHGIFFWNCNHHLVCRRCSHRTDRAHDLFHDLGREPVRYRTVGLWPQLVLGCFQLFHHVDLDRCQTLARRLSCHDNPVHHQPHTHCDHPGRHSQIQCRW